MKIDKIIGWCCIIVGMLCIMYFAILFLTVIQNGFFYYIWLAMGVLFNIVGIFIINKKYTLIPLIIRKIILGLAALGCILFLIVEGFILSGFQKNREVELDYIVVLGALIKESGPSLTLKMRLDEALEYLQFHPDTKVIVSGGQGIDEPISEAYGMQLYLLENGIDETQIIMEDTSTSTSENLTFSSKFIDLENDYVGIVTSNFHVFRATSIAEKLGYDNVVGIAAKSHKGLLVNNLFREFLAVVKDFMVGNLGGLN